MASIEFNNVSFGYEKDKVIIEDASFELEQEESICMVGPNGGGKSTLIKLLLGLIRPWTGQIRVFGNGPESSRHLIGYMPQHLNFDDQFPITTLEVTLMGCLSSGSKIGPYSRKDRASAEAALEKVNLGEMAKKRFSTLSGGQRQRALIARALVSDPKILLLDEPTANVDQSVEEEFHNTLKELAEQISIVLVSHDLGFVSGWLEHVLCVNRSIHMHPTASIDGKTLNEIFGDNIVAIRHDHDCPPGEHIHHHGEDCDHGK